MPKETKKRIVSKKHLARVERERLQSRYILIGSLLVIALTVGLVGYGILDQRVLAPLRPVARVNGEKISLKAWQTRVRYIRQSTVQRAEQTYQIMQMFGEDQSFQQYYISSLQQIAQQLEPTVMGQQVLDGLIDETLIRQEAKRRNITATQEEIDALFQKYFGYYANGTPTPSPTFETRPTSTLNPTQHALLSPTPTATATATPTATLTATAPVSLTLTITPPERSSGPPLVTVTATVSAAVTTLPTPGLTPTAAISETTPTPTPTVYTLEQFQKNFQEEVKGLNDAIQFSEADYRALAELQILSEKVRDAVLADLKHDQDFVWVRHIQVATQEAAQFGLGQLQKGEDFGALASELSEDLGSKSKAGDLGWLNRYDLEDQFGKAFAKTAFEELQVGQVSQVVESDHGFHILQLLGHEMRTLSPDEFDQLREKEFRDWTSEQRTAAKLETFDFWNDFVPTQPDLSPEIRQLLSAASQSPIQP